MSTQTKSKFFLLIIGILLITNIVLLFLLFNKDGGKRPGGNRGVAARAFLQNEIVFNAQQMQQYDTLAKYHREKMKATYEEMRSSKELIFKDLGKQAFSDSAIGQAVTKSLENQKMMEHSFYNHLLEVRKICTVSQLPKFDSFFYKMLGHHRKKGDEKK